ncbi:MAG: ABC transporter substrate-binding protein [Burkholderiaceae bacterium]
MNALARLLLLASLLPVALAARAADELVIATVNNPHMLTMQKMTPFFERANPDVHVRWVTLEEGQLRRAVTADVMSRGGRFDVTTIGMYEAPIWARRGWLEEIRPDAAYDVDDLLPAIRGGLSWQGRLYAAPFYGESSMTLYRQDLAARAHLEMPLQPTWDDIAKIAARLDDPKAGVHGICLRGKAGWGDNMALVSTMVNAYGGQWFDMAWHPRIDAPAWREAVSRYVDLLRRHGPRDAVANGFNENLALFEAGHCAVWVDATIAAALVTDPRRSQVADRVGFVQAPSARTSKGANWLWAWALAIPSDAVHKEQAQRFVRWATSRAYIELVGREVGWSQVPTGTRISTYRNAGFVGQARWAMAEAGAISLADPSDSTLPRSPYVGVQFAAIPEFQAIGQAAGEDIAAALAGRMSVDEALATAQAAADREMRHAGYYK